MHPPENSPLSAKSVEDRLHKPGVAGSSPAAATLDFSEKISDYHADRAWWSKSQLWDLHSRGPLWFHGRYLTGEYTGPWGSSLSKGTNVHSWAEDPEAWWARVAVVPDEFVGVNGAILKKGEAWVAEQAADAVILKPSEVEAYRAQFARLMDDPVFRQLTEQTEHREFSIRWVCEDTGLPVRCRPDAATETVLWDLKTTKDEDPLKTWVHAAHKFGYGFQAALYTRIARAAGFRVKQFVFMVTSTVPPYEACAVTLPQDYLAQCERQVLSACRDLKERLAFDHWLRSERGQITELEVPRYYMEAREHEARSRLDWSE